LRNALCALALLAGWVTAAVPASAIAPGSVPPAGASKHWVYNRTPNCAWVTIDTATPVSAWVNEGHQWIGPGGEHVFTIPATSQLKVRAEPRHSAACSGPRAADVSIAEKGLSAVGNSETTLFQNSAGQYHLRWGK
jgi:hypothetical protein